MFHNEKTVKKKIKKIIPNGRIITSRENGISYWFFFNWITESMSHWVTKSLICWFNKSLCHWVTETSEKKHLSFEHCPKVALIPPPHLLFGHCEVTFVLAHFGKQWGNLLTAQNSKYLGKSTKTFLERGQPPPPPYLMSRRLSK